MFETIVMVLIPPECWAAITRYGRSLRATTKRFEPSYFRLYPIAQPGWPYIRTFSFVPTSFFQFFCSLVSSLQFPYPPPCGKTPFGLAASEPEKRPALPRFFAPGKSGEIGDRRNVSDICLTSLGWLIMIGDFQRRETSRLPPAPAAPFVEGAKYLRWPSLA